MCQITFRRANKGLRGSTLLHDLHSVVGRSADYIFLSYMFHVIARADGQTGRRHQKLDDVQDFIKIQEAKNCLLAVMIGQFMSCLLSQNIYHTKSDLTTALQYAVFFSLKLYQTSTICSSIWVYRFLWSCDYSIKSNHDAKTACRW